MKKSGFVLLFALFSLFSFSQGWRSGEMEVKVRITHPEEIARLKDITDNFEPAASDGSAFRAYLIPNEYKKLKTSGLTFEITIPDLNEHYRNYWDNPLVPPGYYTYEQIISIVDSLATNFPSICKKYDWGTSVAGRQLAALKISDNVSVNENEAELMFDGGIHGDEVGGSQNMIMFARELCLSYGSNPTITDLVDSREIWLFPMVNPDGRATMSRYNKNGVDCNRDNGYMWDGEGFSPSAFSQVETKTLRNSILDHKFVVYTNYHSGTEIISYPWSYRSTSPRDLTHIDHISSIYSGASGYAGGLQYGQGYNIMYAINGSTKDFVYGSLGKVGWSIEISNDKQPPSSQIQYYYDVNKPAMLELIKYAGYGISGTVTDSLTGEPVRAVVKVDNLYPAYTDPAIGDYHKYLVYGYYNITVSANGYKTKSVQGITVPQNGQTVVDFQLVPDTGWYAYMVMSCRIPGNNFGDEGFTPGCIGAPDNTPYAMGKNGWITLDMGDTLYDGPGVDFKVFQSGTQQKNYTVSGSKFLDGPFTVIGTATGTAAFDLSSSQLGRIRYLYIKDNGTGAASGAGAGFNLDAVAMITQPLNVEFSASNQNPCTSEAISFTDLSKGNPVSWQWSFPGAQPSTSNLQHPTGIVYPTPGIYPVTLTISNGVSSLTETKTGFITVSTSPAVHLGPDTVLCNYQTIVLNAANPGASYLWSTGATTQSIVVDSTGIGNSTGTFWVDVVNLVGCHSTDTILITFDNCTGISVNEDDRIVTVFPNPASGNVYVVMNSGFPADWKILATDGRVLKSGKIAGIDAVSIDLTDLPSGIFILTIDNSEKHFTRKIIKL